jgi:hypothetical protein
MSPVKILLLFVVLLENAKFSVIEFCSIPKLMVNNVVFLILDTNQLSAQSPYHLAFKTSPLVMRMQRVVY